MTQALKRNPVISAAVKAVGKSAEDAPHGWVEGVANAFEKDRYDELVLPTALAAAIPGFMRNPVLSFGHRIDGNPTDGSLPAGTVLAITQDAQGNTHFRARFAAHEDAQKVRQLYLDGDMRAFSVQFICLDSRPPQPEELQRWPGLRRVITQLDLIEIALAVVPVNAGSLATAAKSFDGKALPAAPALTTKETQTMSKKALTPEHKELVEATHAAYGAHAEAMKALAAPLSELAEKGDEEADHAGTAALAHKACKAMGESHAALAKSVADLHKAMGGTEDEGEEEVEVEETDDDADETDPNANTEIPPEKEKAFTEALNKALSV